MRDEYLGSYWSHSAGVRSYPSGCPDTLTAVAADGADAVAVAADVSN